MKRFPELDGLRGVLALGVVFVHLQVEGMFWLVVFMDGFFGLSAFVITSGLLERTSASRIEQLKSFYWRRVVRICPPYYVLLIAVAALMLAIDKAAAHADLAGTYGLDSLAPYVVYLQFTDRFWHHDEATSYLFSVRFLRHTWSLAIEEQFYLVWGALFCLTRRPWMKVAAACCFVGIGVAARLSGLVESPLITYRLDAFGYGALFALWYQHAAAAGDSPRLRRYGAVFGAIAALAFCGYWLLAEVPQQYWRWLSQGIPPPHFKWSSASALSSAGCATLVIALACSSGAAAVAFLRSGPLLYLGRISYCLYLVHYPIIDLLLHHDVKLLDAGPVGNGIAVLVLSIGSAHLLTGASERLSKRLLGQRSVRHERGLAGGPQPLQLK
jgi:peptidoglycan/LPS O-acetylase OafA/YrhL